MMWGRSDRSAAPGGFDALKLALLIAPEDIGGVASQTPQQASLVGVEIGAFDVGHYETSGD
jgi:hypothetical protein